MRSMKAPLRIAIIATLLLAFATPAGARDLPQNLPKDFVYLRAVAPTIAQDMRYATYDNFTGRPLPGYEAPECVLRREVAQALARVQADLAREHLSLKTYDCYRPARAVRAFWRWANDVRRGGAKRFYPRVPKAELFARGYIATHSRHSAGIAVDLTLVPLGSAQPPAAHSRASGNPEPQAQTLQVSPGSPLEPVLGPAAGRTRVRGRTVNAASAAPCTAPAAQRAPDTSLDIGTGFDCLDVKSYTRSGKVTPAQRHWRNVLKAAMTRAGFRNYFREWWHYEFAGSPRRSYDFPIVPRAGH
jgi:D-alanyl-D-alanine dipeptidase